MLVRYYSLLHLAGTTPVPLATSLVREMNLHSRAIIVDAQKSQRGACSKTSSRSRDYCKSSSSRQILDLGRTPEFWAGRRRRQESSEAGRIMQCYFSHIRTANIVNGWFGTDPGPYDLTRPNQSGIVNLPNKRKTRLSRGFDSGLRYNEEYVHSFNPSTSANFNPPLSATSNPPFLRARDPFWLLCWPAFVISVG